MRVWPSLAKEQHNGKFTGVIANFWEYVVVCLYISLFISLLALIQYPENYWVSIVGKRPKFALYALDYELRFTSGYAWMPSCRWFAAADTVSHAFPDLTRLQSGIFQHSIFKKVRLNETDPLVVYKAEISAPGKSYVFVAESGTSPPG